MPAKPKPNTPPVSNDEVDEWDPSKPLEDEEEELEAGKRARAHGRYEYLKEEHKKKIKREKKEEEGAPPEKKFSVFDDK